MIQIGAQAATIDSPVEHLVACHRRIEQRLDTLVQAAGHLAENRSEALTAIERSLQFLDSSGVLHTRDEEESLFPRLRGKLEPGETAFLDSLESQHSAADQLYAELKQQVRRLPSAQAAEVGVYVVIAERLRSLYRDHIRAEDEVLTALAKRHLSETEVVEIAREMRARRAK